MYAGSPLAPHARESAGRINGPDSLARGIAFGLPISLGLWAALALIVF
jgi:hypothetical protein